MAHGLKLDVKGIEDYLERIEKAGGNVDAAAMKAIKESADVAERELRNAASAKVPSSITEAITTEVSVSGNTYFARVGWKRGIYDPKNLSQGYKAIFLNYGTPRVKPRNFIETAKKKAKKPIKDIQNQVLDDILKELEK